MIPRFGWVPKREIAEAVGVNTDEFLKLAADRASAAGLVPVGRGRAPAGATVVPVATCTSRGGPGTGERIYFSRYIARGGK